MKFSIYSMLVNVDKGLVLFNSKNSSYVNIFKQKDIKHIEELCDADELPEDDIMVQQLYERKYIVDDDINEYEEEKKFIEDKYRKMDRSLRVMLYVTEACNFRCIYCPQKHNPQILSDEKWSSFTKYIKTCIQQDKFDYFHITFIGGEPLLRKDKILEFMSDIYETKKSYPDKQVGYQITTNGYLLTPEVYDKMRDYGLKIVQVTVDGFAETHDKMRPLADGSPSWNTVISNLKHINSENDNVKVIFRTNCNDTNLESIDKFCEWSNKTFDNKKFCFNVSAVTKFTDQVDDSVVFKEDKLELPTIIQKYQRSDNPTESKLRPLGLICACSLKHYYIISVEGKIYKCEHAYENLNDEIGYLSDDGDVILNEAFNNWVDHFEYDNCKDCLLYPICAARACPSKKVSSTDIRCDCMANLRDVAEYIADMIRHGYLNKDHISKDTDE